MQAIRLDANDALPLTDQIVAAVRSQIDDRVLRAGMRLPPIRRFAEEQEVSRFTVVEAYDRLVAQGYLVSRRGAGFFVAPRRAPETPEEPSPLERAVDTVWLLRQGFDSDSERLKVGAGWLPADWMDEEGLRRNLRTLSRRADLDLVSYGSPQGYAPLRQQLQVMLGDLGIAAQPRQILLTHGATQALDLIARRLIRPGDCVLVDDPGYWTLFGNLRLHGARLVGVPRTLDGPDTAALESILAEHKPKLFFTHSVLHNPTAANLSPATAYRVLQLAERHDFMIVEDDTYADFLAGPATRLATLDQLQRVIYVGSYSKTLSGNLRVGFAACQPDLAGELTDLKLLSALPCSEFSERMVYLMLIEGHYRKYVERVRARLEERTYATLRLLERRGLSTYTEPEGGMFAWAKAEGLADATPLADRAARNGIMLAPGKLFRPRMEPSPWLRFNVAFAGDKRLDRFLGEALDAC
jgi:DNA-binding transcriptional MocR family regulator